MPPAPPGQHPPTIHHPVGAGHARPATLRRRLLPVCIVGRGLDPSAGRRGRRPLQHNPQGFSLPQTSAAAWGQAALHPTLPHSVGRAFARNSFTPPRRGRACPARSLAIVSPLSFVSQGGVLTPPGTSGTPPPTSFPRPHFLNFLLYIPRKIRYNINVYL